MFVSSLYTEQMAKSFEILESRLKIELAQIKAMLMSLMHSPQQSQPLHQFHQQPQQQQQQQQPQFHFQQSPVQMPINIASTPQYQPSIGQVYQQYVQHRLHPQQPSETTKTAYGQQLATTPTAASTALPLAVAITESSISNSTLSSSTTEIVPEILSSTISSKTPESIERPQLQFRPVPVKSLERLLQKPKNKQK